MNLKNKTILITGGSSGIGLEFVKQLNQLGATLIITGRNKEKLNEVKSMFPNVHTIESDMGNTEDIMQLHQILTVQHPQLDIVINNAGIMRKISLQQENLSLDELTSEIEVNLNGIIKLNHLLIPHLKTKKEAAIVNISSGLAFVPFLASPIYSVAKAGLHAYTKLLRLELKNTTIKVFEIAPPSTNTSLISAFNNPNKPTKTMNPEQLVSISIIGITKNKFEIIPGLAAFLYLMSRVAPGVALRMVNT